MSATGVAAVVGTDIVGSAGREMDENGWGSSEPRKKNLGPKRKKGGKREGDM